MTELDPALRAGNRRPLADHVATHFRWTCADGVATITLDRPARKNPLTFDAYASCATCSAGCATPTTSRSSCCRAPATTSVPAATCTRSSAR